MAINLLLYIEEQSTNDGTEKDLTKKNFGVYIKFAFLLLNNLFIN